MSKEKVIEMDIECQACNGTGVFTGMGERDGAAVMCYRCDGTGQSHYKFTYKEFTGRQKRKDIKRVYLTGYGYCVSPKPIDYDRIGFVDMSKEGVSYEEFLEGKNPKHIRKMACPLLADQGKVHDLKLYDDRCSDHCGYGNISSCDLYPDKNTCWDIFDKETNA